MSNCCGAPTDAPAYVRNLFNTTVIAYSGELDKQIQAARVMEQAYESEGRKLRHLIGPGVAHQYEPATLQKLLDELQQAVTEGRDAAPEQVHLQTRTLRYSKMHWVEALRLQRHWQDARVDASLQDQQWTVVTRNIDRLRLHPPRTAEALLVDGQTVARNWRPREIILERNDGAWREANDTAEAPLQKRPGLQGPIDDAFLDAFLVVTPIGPGRHPAVDRWVHAELDHLRRRWKALFRATLPEKPANEVTQDDARAKNLILWGDGQSNPWIAKLLDAGAGWSSASVGSGAGGPGTAAGRRGDARSCTDLPFALARPQRRDESLHRVELRPHLSRSARSNQFASESQAAGLGDPADRGAAQRAAGGRGGGGGLL